MKSSALAAALTIALVSTCNARAQEENLPPPFKNMLQVVCKDEAIALALVAVYDDRGEEVGDALLARLQAKGACEWRTISGRPIADLYPGKNVPSPRLVGGQYVLQRHALKVDVITPEGVPEAPPAYMLMTYVSAPEA